MKKCIIFKIALFIVLFAILFSLCDMVLKHPSSDIDSTKYIPGFYREPDDTLQAVYIGASNVFCFWAAPLAWENYGITVYPFSSGGQKMMAPRYLIEEARKTQPNALFIVGLNDSYISGTMPVARIHNLLDYMPVSKNKYELLRELCDAGEMPLEDRLEFYVPFIRYHSRWSSLTAADFTNEFGNYKGGDIHPNILGGSVDVSASYRKTERRGELSDTQMQYMTELLQYCKEEDLNMLFVLSDSVTKDEALLANLNTVGDLCESYGFPVLDLRDKNDEIGLDLTKDYCNLGHVNLHGMIKCTDYLSRYLIENYGFEDRRGDPAYSSWDAAYDEYVDIISDYSLDFEYENGARDYRLTAPELTKIAVNGPVLTLSWKQTKGADGYCVYRKTDKTGWEQVATVDADTYAYADADCKIQSNYTYTVVPFRNNGEEILWGDYNYSGLSATALLNAPQNVRLITTENDPTIAWDPVDGADGYIVSRGVCGKSWINQADVGAATLYLDTTWLEDLPYLYRVIAYQNNEAGEQVYGSWSAAVEDFPTLPGPSVTAELVGGVPVLSWPAVEGITNYTVTRRTTDGDWEQIAEPLANTAVQFRDITAQAGVSYEYQVTANLVYAKQTYPYPSEPVTVTAEAGPTPLVPPEIVFSEQVGNIVQLVWEPSANATAYRIYRQAEGENEWTVIRPSQGGVTYQDKPPAAGTYAYTLQPLRTENGCIYYGTFDGNAAGTAAYGVE